MLWRLLGDTRPPDTQITKGPKRKVKLRKKAKFRFQEVGDVHSRFVCRLKQPRKKAKPFTPCTSPYRKKVRRLGKHVFKVRAIDPAGNVDVSPAKKKL